MNKKLATLLFAVGMGASASSALAFIPGDEPSCDSQCFTMWQACKAEGVDPAQCQADFSACRDRCGI